MTPEMKHTLCNCGDSRDASISGMDSNRCWDCSFHLAKYSEIPIVARLTWQEKPEAAFPGETGVLEWNPQV
jgi:hypothetical protein